MYLAVFLLQGYYTLVILSIAIVPLTRAALYLASVLYSSSKIHDLDLLNESYPRPSDAFLHLILQTCMKGETKQSTFV